MTSNANLNHDYVFLEGGTGGRIGLSSHHYLSSKAYANKGATDGWKFIYETMDAGGEEIDDILKLGALDKAANYNDPKFFFAFLKLAERVKELLSSDETMTLDRIAPEWFKNELLLTKEELLRNLLGGYYRDLVLGSVVSAVAMNCALQTTQDKNAGFQAVVNDVIASNNNYEVRVVFAGNGWSGEGRTNLCMHPSMLKKLCIQRVMDALHMQRTQAENYVDNNLKIAVIMTGSAFRFPAVEGLDQDIADLLTGTLRNFPDDSADAVNLFYLLEHDACPTQADKASESGKQFKHAHAIELVAVAAIEDFFNRDTASVSKRQCPVIPHYSMPGKALTNWENLGLSESYREYLSARLRFDAALIYWLRPQLIVSSDEQNAGKIYESEFLHRLFKVNTPKQVEETILTIGMDLDEEIIKPFKALLAKETMFLEYLADVCQTGKNWETNADPSPKVGTDLFNLARIEHMLGENPNILDFGGMTGFSFDELTKCPKNTMSGKQEENLYNTRLTMDKLRKRTVYNEHGKRRSFQDILDNIYDICSERKVNKKYGIF